MGRGGWIRQGVACGDTWNVNPVRKLWWFAGRKHLPQSMPFIHRMWSCIPHHLVQRSPVEREVEPRAPHDEPV